eukprot:TRINITY_DN7306_c0_g1_i1.p1 TRINITY_DN7306_c0_g1~~TRINITY_DN7306_c0_g1_i1.p1  ORF type:complete len:326 (+),score=76.71 TRINITY_DN7306_c0_g1_i1:86-1063(+)
MMFMVYLLCAVAMGAVVVLVVSFMLPYMMQRRAAAEAARPRAGSRGDAILTQERQRADVEAPPHGARIVRRPSLPRQCYACGEYIHPSLYDGHVEVCKIQMLRRRREQEQQQAECPPATSSSSRAAPPPAAASDSDESDIPEDQACVICLTRRRQIAFIPCGHWTSCKRCSPLLTTCPMCREPISKRLCVDGEAVNKCPVCTLQIHHTFFQSHREVCRIQMQRRKREAEEEEQARKDKEQAELLPDGAADTGDVAIAIEPESAPPGPSTAGEGGDEARCVICLKEKREVAFTPCGHWAACTACSDKITECPVCNATITSRLTIYS